MNDRTVNEIINDAKEKQKAEQNRRDDIKIRAAGSYLIQKHINALKELAK